MSEKEMTKEKALGILIGGLVSGLIIGQFPLLMVLFTDGCGKYRAEREMMEMAQPFAEKLAEIEEEQGAMWEVINDMDPNLPSPTPKYEDEESYSQEQQMKFLEDYGREQMYRHCWDHCDYMRNWLGDSEEDRLKCRDGCIDYYDGLEDLLEKHCVQDPCLSEELCARWKEQGHEDAYNARCVPIIEAKDELGDCLADCKWDKKYADITPKMYKECEWKCKNQYGEEE